ncbi:MAG: ABC transporter permease [Desulfurococcus sp.]|nr:ABC transporter permease [Desulfurococcus sp.]
MGLAGYIARRIVLYTAVFFTALSITWLIPRLLGNPIAIVVARLGPSPAGAAIVASYFMQAFGFDKPLYEQYFLFLRGLLSGDLGVSLWLLGRPVSSIVYKALIFDIILMAPAIIISWFIGNYLGALAARHKRLDRVLMPVLYILAATPYFVLAMLLQWTLTVRYKAFPTVISSTILDQMLRSPTWESISSFLHAITLPMLSLIVVSMGGWASGMRTMMIYELESNYSRFMEMLGMSEKKISLYAFRYAINPQISGLGVQLGTLVVGAAGVEYIFNYPGLGYFLFNAIINNDPFLLQGAILLLVLMVIAANFIVDILYAILDPRIRIGVVS